MGEIIAVVAAVATGIIGLIQYRMKASNDLNVLREQVAAKAMQQQIEELAQELAAAVEEAAQLKAKLVLVESKNARLRREIDALALAIGSGVKSEVVAFVKCDKAGTIIEWNAGATILLGFSEEEILGRDLMVIVSPQQRQLHHAAFFALANSDRQPRKTPLFVVAMNKAGRSVFVALNLSRWKEGQVDYFSGEMTEISRQQYQEQRAVPT